MHLNRFLLLAALALSQVNPTGVQGQDQWPRFRGPNGSGVATASLRTRWESTDYRWTVKLPGVGSSSPVIWDSLLVVSSADPKTAAVQFHGIDTETGSIRWTKTYQATPYPVHGRNRFAASTPAIDRDRVYVTLADPDHVRLIALDHEGNEIWQRDFGRWISQHGFGMSPMLMQDRVILVNSQQSEGVPTGVAPGVSEVIAVDSATGKDIWRTPLTTTRACYSVPCLLQTGKGMELIGTNTGDGFYSLDPATGRMNWSYLPFKMRTVASTVASGSMVLGSCGSGGGGNYLIAGRRTDDGFETVFEIKQSANYVPTPIVVNDLLFLFNDKGVATCLDLQSGQQQWRERVSGAFSGSPVSDGHNLFVVDEAGTVHVISAARTFKSIGEVDLGEGSFATPAIHANRLYLRTESQLFCVDGSDNSE